MKTAMRMTAIALTLGVLGVATAEAQTNNATVDATATVLQPINVTGARDLAFGNVFPGVNASIPVTDPNSGLWAVTGQAAGNVQLTFGLPATLTSGANSMPIGTYVGHWNPANSPIGGTNFDPTTAPINAQLDIVTGELYVFIGATVSPAVNQASGAYSGTLSMTVVYF
jgi:hypothetical protein